MKLRWISVCLCWLLAGSTGIFAQVSTSSITGTVTDSTGAVIAGARVTALHEQTGTRYTTTTTEAGIYSFSALVVGRYTITVEADGFKKWVSAGNTLAVGEPLVVNAVLEVGDISEVVQVDATYERLNTTNAMISGVVSRTEIAQLPLNGRNPLNLVVLEPGLVQRPTGAAGSGTHVFGSRDRAHNVTIDGIDANESSVPNPQSNVFRLTPDNVQEYRVVTHNATPEYGRNSGANVSIATRSGTNEFHGDVFYNHRNTALNANESFNKLFGQDRPRLLLHQWGGDVGGPVIKNRTFFFFSYQGNRILQTQPISQSFGIPLVYTEMARNGLFRYVKGTINVDGVNISQNDRRLVDEQGNLKPGVPVCANPATDTNCVATYNIFSSDPALRGPDPRMMAMIDSLPLPNSFTSVGDGLNTAGFVWNTPSKFTGPFFLFRGDHKFNDNHNVFARILWSEYNTNDGDLLNARPRLFPGFNPLGEVFRSSQSLAVSYRAVLSPRLVNEFTMGYSRFNFFFSLAESNLAGGSPVPWGQECFGTDSTSNIDTPFCNTPHTQRAVSTIQYIDNLSYTTGAHNIRTGFNFRFYRHNDSRGVPGGFNMAPTVVFSQSVRSPTANTAPGVSAGFPAAPGINSSDVGRLNQAIVELMGIPARVQQVFQADLSGDQYTTNLFTLGTRIRQFNLYAQDEWRILRNLTINYGLRWEYNRPPTDCCNRVFVPDKKIDGSEGPVAFVPADSWFRRNNWSTFAPRVGLAWDPWGDGKTVVRLGYGIAFDTISSFQVTAIGGKVPGSVLQCFTTIPFGTSPAAPPAGCADLRGVVPTNARLSELVATLGETVSQPLPPATPSSLFSPPPRPAGTAPGVGAFDPNLKVPTVHEWSLTIQRELPWGFTAQIGYIGKRGIRLYRAYDLNQIRTDQPGFLESFLIAQQNIFNGCRADGTGCPAGVTGQTPTLLLQLTNSTLGSSSSFLNSSTTRSNLQLNGLGDLAARIDQLDITQVTANRPTPFPADYFRPNPQFSDIFYFDSGGGSIYHGMLVQLRRKFEKGLTFGLSYTLAKSIDDMSVDPVAASSGGGLSTTNSRTPTDVRNFGLDRAVSDFDNRHVVVMNILYELPFGRGRRWASGVHPALNHLIGGWTITTIYIFQSGEPFTLNSGSRTVHNTKQSRASIRGPFIQPGLFNIPGVDGPVVYNVGSRITDPADPNYNCRNILTPDGTATSSFFCIPAPGENGNTGRNAVYGPGFWNADIGILKQFTLTERIGMQFRAELFNAFNHPNFDNPRNASDGSPTLTSSLFGQTCCVTSAVPSSTTVIANGEPNRVIQFALRITF